MNCAALEKTILDLDALMRGHVSPAIWQAIIAGTAAQIRAERAGKVVGIRDDDRARRAGL